MAPSVSCSCGCSFPALPLLRPVIPEQVPADRRRASVSAPPSCNGHMTRTSLLFCFGKDLLYSRILEEILCFEDAMSENSSLLLSFLFVTLYCFLQIALVPPPYNKLFDQCPKYIWTGLSVTKYLR